MTTLQEIENLLDIEIGDKRLRNGRKNPNKNKYYRYDNYYIVSLTRGKWMIIDNDSKNRKLLKKHTWCAKYDGYCQTAIHNTNKRKYVSKNYHQLLLNYEGGLMADHINRHRFDNRFDNFRIVTNQENCRNKTIQINNSSGITGISRKINKHSPYWIARIHDNNGRRLWKAFNINKYGEEESKRLAIEQRNAWKIEFGYIGE